MYIRHWSPFTSSESFFVSHWHCSLAKPSLDVECIIILNNIILILSLSLSPSRFSLVVCSWEKNYDPVPVLSWMSERPWLPVVACLAYGAAIVGGRAYFATHDRWHWRTTLALWNAALSAFSTVGLLRTLPQLVHNLWLAGYSLTDNLCWDPQITYGSGSTGLWVQLFILSKFPYVSSKNTRTRASKLACVCNVSCTYVFTF